METMLKMNNITKRFPGVVANDSVTFKLNKGEIHALLGENGAGKTTLMNILYGLIQPDIGEITVKDEIITIRSPNDALANGVGMVHQHFMLVPNMTVTENVILGDEPKWGPFLQLEKAVNQIEQLSSQFGLDVDPDRFIWELSVGEQQRVEILKVVYRGANILILDEPTAALTPPEVEGLFKILKGMVKKGKSIIFITHKLKEVMEISDRVTVMRGGKVQGTLETSQTDQKQLANMQVGRDIVYSVARHKDVLGDVVSSLKNVWVQGNHKRAAVSDVSFDLHSGEILGIAGVDGNGQSELAEAIVGLRKTDSGKLFIHSEDMTDSPVWKRIDMGLMYVPADRKTRGLAADLSVSANSIMKNHRSSPFSNNGILKPAEIKNFATHLVKEYDVRCRSIDTKAGTLSGGNLQKLLLARETAESPQFLVASHPTRGLDVGATEYIRSLLLDIRDEGTAILLISADLDEVLSLSDRVLVMYEGKIVFQCRHEEIDREKIGVAMAGLQQEESENKE